jgi:hypothetical protein
MVEFHVLLKKIKTTNKILGISKTKNLVSTTKYLQLPLLFPKIVCLIMGFLLFRTPPFG